MGVIMDYKVTMEEMKNQLMYTLKQDEQYNTINNLCDDIIKTTNDKIIKTKVGLIRRNVNVSIIRGLIGNVLIYNKIGNTEQDFFDYKADFEKLEDLCMIQIIEENKDL